MSPYRNTKKNNLLIGVIALIVIFVLWCLISWTRKFQRAVLPVYADSAALALESKQSLVKKVLELQSTIDAQQASLTAFSTLESENTALKNELQREGHSKGILARVIVPPNRSLYDTIVIDVGSDEGVVVGQKAYAFGSIALGTVSEVSEKTSTILLYSASGRETAGTTAGSDIAVTLIGRGGGEYEVRMPRDIVFQTGGVITEQSLAVHPIATIQKIVTDPRDPFQRLLAKAPVNLQTMKWVIVR